MDLRASPHRVLSGHGSDAGRNFSLCIGLNWLRELKAAILPRLPRELPLGETGK
jgi:hypothetical protein